MKKLLAAMAVSTVISFPGIAAAQIKLPALIRDSMILQRDSKVNIWGWSSPEEKISLALDHKRFRTTADKNGNWKIIIPPVKAGGPYRIELSGKNKIVIENVLFGDVWFCSGQSNMVHQMNIHDVRYANEIATANYPMIRQFWVPNSANMAAAQENLSSGTWQAAVGNNVRPFSAVAYFFAKKIYEKYHIPVGIINASVGGSPIEAWVSEDGLKDFPTDVAAIQKNKDTAYINILARRNGNFRMRQQTDMGLTGEKKWFEVDYVPKGWRNINIPGYWEDQGLKDLNGVVWYRKEINIAASMTGKSARIFMGRIVDAEEFYINGKLIGSTGYQYPQRRYTVPDGVLKEGKNIFVVKVSNTSGKGGFVPDKPYCLFAGGDTLDLMGTWQYKVGDVFKPFFGGASGPIAAQNQPAALYNAMVAPEINYTIKGFCWYQGESNTGNASEYTYLMKSLIEDWRKSWQADGMLPFLYVQLPGFMDYNYLPSESSWAQLREAQLKALTIPATAMAVAIDLGEWNDIHPDKKKEVGERLALAALKMAYGADIVYSGPLYQSSVIDSGKIIISFSEIGSGLVTNDEGAPADFAIAGKDKKFVWAKTRIEGNKVIVWSPDVLEPLYVRYAWADNPVNPNLYNREGLPASPFRTD